MSDDVVNMIDITSAAAKAARNAQPNLHGLPLGSLAQWIIAAVIVPLAAGFFYVLPGIINAVGTRKSSIDVQRAADMDKWRSDMAEMREQIARLNSRCTAYEIRAAQVEFMLGEAIEEIDHLTPGNTPNPVVKRIRNYLAQTKLDPSGISQDLMDRFRSL
jgi:hypothetical protein